MKTSHRYMHKYMQYFVIFELNTWILFQVIPWPRDISFDTKGNNCSVSFKIIIFLDSMLAILDFKMSATS